MNNVSLVRAMTVGLLSIALVGTACGGDDDRAAPPAPEPVLQTTAAPAAPAAPNGMNSSVPAVEITPYCAELQAITDEITDVGASADSGLGQMVALISGLKSLDSYLARLQDQAVGEVAQSFASVREAIDRNVNTFSVGDSLEQFLAYVLLQGISILPDIDAIDDYTARECGGKYIFGLSGEKPIPVSPRPTNDGRGIIIDGRNHYGEELCESLSLPGPWSPGPWSPGPLSLHGDELPTERFFFDDTLTVECRGLGFLIFSTSTWALIDVVEYPTGFRNVTIGGPTIAMISEVVIPASGLEPERMIERLHIWQRGPDGFTDPVEIETTARVLGVTANGNVVIGDDLIAGDGSLITTRAGAREIRGSYLVAVDEHLLRDSRLDLYDDLLSSDRSERPLLVIYDDFGAKISDLTPEVLNISNEQTELGRDANLHFDNVSICGDTVLLIVDNGPFVEWHIVADLRTGLASQVPDNIFEFSYDLLTPHGVVVYAKHDGDAISGFSADGGSWSIDFPEGLIQHVFVYDGLPIAVNSSGEYLEFDSDSGELLDVRDELFTSSKPVLEGIKIRSRFGSGSYLELYESVDPGC